MVKGAFARLERSPVAKGAMAVLLFCLIVGGWMGYRQYRQAQQTLPGLAGQSGPCTLWFVGSSSIHRWTSLQGDMAPWPVIRRGVENAGYNEILRRFANAGNDAPPAAIILYVGENDIARGATARTVVRNLAAFLGLRRRMMDDVPVLVLSMKPSPGRWANFATQQQFNAAAREVAKHMPATYYTDITGPLLPNGRMGDNYRADGVHMNAAGYRIWSGVVRQRLREVLPASRVAQCEGAAR